MNCTVHFDPCIHPRHGPLREDRGPCLGPVPGCPSRGWTCGWRAAHSGGHPPGALSSLCDLPPKKLEVLQPSPAEGSCCPCHRSGVRRVSVLSARLEFGGMTAEGACSAAGSGQPHDVVPCPCHAAAPRTHPPASSRCSPVIRPDGGGTESPRARAGKTGWRPGGPRLAAAFRSACWRPPGDQSPPSQSV